jgi:hypothetical protein
MLGTRSSGCGDQELAQFERRLRQLGQETASILNLGVVLDLTGSKSGGEVYWRKAGSERFTPIHRGAKNYNGVPAQYFFLARKWRALVW